MESFKKELQKAISAKETGTRTEKARKIIEIAAETYRKEIERSDPHLRDCIECIINIPNNGPFTMFCKHAVALIEKAASGGAPGLSCAHVAERFGLHINTVQRRAAYCPGAYKFGNYWAFPNNVETAEYFSNIKPRRKRKLVHTLNIKDIAELLGMPVTLLNRYSKQCPDAKYNRKQCEWKFVNDDLTWLYFGKIKQDRDAYHASAPKPDRKKT